MPAPRNADTSSATPNQHLRRRPRDLYKEELVDIVERLTHVLFGVDGEEPHESVDGDRLLDPSAFVDLHRALADHGIRPTRLPNVEMELSLLRSIGSVPLSDAARTKLRAVYEWPTDRTWHAAHSVSITPLGESLWQMIQDLDPTFPRHRPYVPRTGSRRPWERVPSSEMIRRALVHALVVSPVRDDRDAMPLFPEPPSSTPWPSEPGEVDDES